MEKKPTMIPLQKTPYCIQRICRPYKKIKLRAPTRTQGILSYDPKSHEVITTLEKIITLESVARIETQG